MTHQPHDALFKRAFEQPEQLADLCRGLLPPAVVEAIAWDTVTPLPTSFIEPGLDDLHSDILFEVELAGQAAYLHVLVEHQSTVDPLMALRVLHYLVLVWKRHAEEHGRPLPPVVSVVVAHAPGGWGAPRSVHELVAPPLDLIPELAKFVPNVEFILDDLTAQTDQQLRERAMDALSRLALWLLKSGRDGPTLLASLDKWRSVLGEAFAASSGPEGLAHLFRYVALVMGELNFAAFRGKVLEVLPESKQIVMTIAEELRQEGLIQGLEKGRREGRQEGRQEGRVEALVATLTKQITLKFGPPSAELVARLEATAPEQLERYTERILSAASVDELLG